MNTGFQALARRALAAMAVTWLLTASAMVASAQNAAPPQPPAAPPETASGFALKLSASLAAGQAPLASGAEWRIFQERAEPDGSHPLIDSSTDAAPVFHLPDGDYVVHVAWGLASAMRRVAIRGAPIEQRLIIGAGALRISAILGDASIPPNRLQISIYVPERGGAESRLVVADAHSETSIRLPEGSYRIVSTYLDKEGAGTTPGAAGRGNATNSVVNAEVRVQAGKRTDVTLRHHAAVLTLKLVNTPGGEALANTSFSVLTPGGDVIRELIGAFPSLILAEGEYVVIARRDNKTYQGTFKVQSALDRDIEVLTQ